MILISHRGNTTGMYTEWENNPAYIDATIAKGYDVEVDIWYRDASFWLGHDEPQYQVDIKWFLEREPKLWIHCKNLEALFEVKKYALHYFWHENDTITLTSKNYVWAYPTATPIQNSIAVLPERYKAAVSKCRGVCSDYISKYAV